VRTNEKRRLRNRAAKSALKTGLKRVEVAFESKEPEAIKRVAHEALCLVGKTRRKGVVSRKRAARLQSRIQRKLNQALVPAAPSATE